LKERFSQILKEVILSAPLFKPIIKKALFMIGDSKKETMLLITGHDFFEKLSKDFKLIRKTHPIPNLLTFLCLDPVKFPNYILVNKLCKALEFFMGNACLKSLGAVVSNAYCNLCYRNIKYQYAMWKRLMLSWT